MSALGLDVKGFEDAILDPHSHMVVVAIVGLIVAVAVVRFGVPASQSIRWRTTARAGAWIAIVGVLLTSVVLGAVAFLNFAARAAPRRRLWRDRAEATDRHRGRSSRTGRRLRGNDAVTFVDPSTGGLAFALYIAGIAMSCAAIFVAGFVVSGAPRPEVDRPAT